MHVNSILTSTMISLALVLTSGCAVVRDQQSVGEYVDDSALTARVKGKFAEDKAVSAMAISVETFNGVVQLSGAAKSHEERSQAEALASKTSGVKSVRNAIMVRP
jgi:hyperosmotically inducible periplasmic protein